MKKIRRGSLLIQQLILIALSGMVMLVAIQLIHQSLTFAGSFQKQYNAIRSSSLLLRQFRADSHNAALIAFQEGRGLIFQTINGTQVTYRALGNYIEREEANGSSEPFKRDRYSLGLDRVASFQETETTYRLLIETRGHEEMDRRSNHKSLLVEIPREDSLQGGDSHGR